MATKWEWAAIESCTNAVASGDGSTIFCWQKEAGQITPVDLTERKLLPAAKVDVGERIIAGIGAIADRKYFVGICQNGEVLFWDAVSGRVVSKWNPVVDRSSVDHWALSAYLPLLRFAYHVGGYRQLDWYGSFCSGGQSGAFGVVGWIYIHTL